MPYLASVATADYPIEPWSRGTRTVHSEVLYGGSLFPFSVTAHHHYPSNDVQEVAVVSSRFSKGIRFSTASVSGWIRTVGSWALLPIDVIYTACSITLVARIL